MPPLIMALALGFLSCWDAQAAGPREMRFSAEPRFEIGVMHYEFKQDDLVIANLNPENSPTEIAVATGIQVSDSMPFISAGASFFWGSFFADLYGQIAFSGEDSAGTQFVFRSAEPETIVQLTSDNEWDRQEYGFTVGYQFFKNGGVYTGYKLSRTEFTVDSIVSVLSTAEPATQIVGVVGEELTYTQSGPFVGVFLTANIEQGRLLDGVLSLASGVAFTKGEIERRFLQVPLSPAKADGSTIGANVRLSWTGRLSRRWLYSVAVDGYQYDFASDSERAPDFSERVIKTTFAFSYLF